MSDSNISSLSLPALQAEDPTELARMVDLYSPKIYRLALRIVGDEQDAEDVLQETFIKAIQSIKTFEGRSSIATWLYRIASNEALMLLRKRKVVMVPVEEEVEDGDEQRDGMQIVDWCCLPENEFLTAETRNFLDQAIGTLPLNLKMVFLLRDIQGLSVRETAEALGLTEVNVKTRLLRARLFLRQQLSDYFRERIPGRSDVTQA